jgi:hypothetical protein
MFKIKLLPGIAALAATLLVLAAPAYAEFESTSGQTQGKIKTFPGETTFEATAGGVPITCKSATGEPAGEWQIQVKTQKQQGKFFYQEAAKKGPHLQLKITKWGTCATLGVAGTVTCNLQIESASVNGNTGSVYPPGCEVKFGTGEHICIVKVQPDGNKELSLVKLLNLGASELEVNSEIKGVTSTLQDIGEECKTLTVKGGQGTGAFKTKSPLIAEGVKIV